MVISDGMMWEVFFRLISELEEEQDKYKAEFQKQHVQTQVALKMWEIDVRIDQTKKIFDKVRLYDRW